MTSPSSFYMKSFLTGFWPTLNTCIFLCLSGYFLNISLQKTQYSYNDTDSISIGWNGPVVCISNICPGDVDTAGPHTAN